MSKSKKLLLLSYFLIPGIIYAESDFLPFAAALFMEAFVSIHMSVFVLIPIAKMFSKDSNHKPLFWKLFAVRAAILLICDAMGYTQIALVDFFGVFIGAFIVVPILLAIKKPQNVGAIFGNISSLNTTTNKPLTNCPSCNAELKPTDKFCTSCGVPIVTALQTPIKGTLVKPIDFDPIYSLSEDKLLEEFIKKEMVKADIAIGRDIPSGVLKRKNALNVILAILLFAFMCLIFFHFPLYTYMLGIIIIIVFLVVTRKYDLMDYIVKEIKSRPNEKISNIIMNIKNSFVPDTSKTLRKITIAVALLAPLIIFYKPLIFYETIEDAYSIRFYTYGLTEYKNAYIPSSHNGKPVVSIRGNVFANMYFLETVTLPDSITEIRGEAFKNDIKLRSVKLPSNLTEIKGSTFENCNSLESIEIPDTVTRIGGHAFYNCTGLREVDISSNSQLNEIGSSAFRNCYSLKSITIPYNAYVNDRAFKNSPTQINYYRDDGTKLSYKTMTVVLYDNQTRMVELEDRQPFTLDLVYADYSNKTFQISYNEEPAFMLGKHTNTSYIINDDLIIEYYDCVKYSYLMVIVRYT